LATARVVGSRQADIFISKTTGEPPAWSRQGRGRLLPTHQLDIKDIWQI